MPGKEHRMLKKITIILCLTIGVFFGLYSSYSEVGEAKPEVKSAEHKEGVRAFVEKRTPNWV